MIAVQTGASAIDALPAAAGRRHTTGWSMLAVSRDVLTHRIRFARDEPA